MSFRRLRFALGPASKVFMAAVIAAVMAGCGGDKKSKDEATSDDQGADEAAADPSPKERKTAAGKSTGKKKSGKSQGTHIGEIPKDVWPEVWLKDPLAVAGESGSAAVAQAAPADDGAAKPEKSGSGEPPAEIKPATGTGSAAKSGDADWAALISGEDITDETKAIKNALTQTYQDVGRYSSTYKTGRVDAATLTALAGVVPEHPEPPNWKANAKYIRDVSAEIAKASSANGEKFFKPARKAYDKLDALFSGSKPPDLDEAADKIKFSEVANRYYLMERMKRSYEFMKSNVNTEPAFKKESAKVSHEAAILAILAKIIATPDYGDADADDYRQFAEAVSKSGAEVRAAVKDQDFKAYTAALDKCYRACNDCHQNFKNN